MSIQLDFFYATENNMHFLFLIISILAHVFHKISRSYHCYINPNYCKIIVTGDKFRKLDYS